MEHSAYTPRDSIPAGHHPKMPSSLEDYEVVSTIGTGSYGTCKKIRRKKDGKVLVWKELEYGVMSETEKQMLVAEVNLLRELKHRHIVRYYDRIIDRTHFTLYIIMEFCEGGDLAQRINKGKKEGSPMEEEFVWKICTQVVAALLACHTVTEQSNKKVLHRDLKPANVFLDADDNVKLGDFGLARVLNHETSFAKTFVGTPYYMSPEQMNYLSYNEKSDIWSLGCLLYELCALRPPFTAANQRELATRICDGRFARIPTRYSDGLNEVIKYMLQVDEFKRPSILEVSKHPLVIKQSSRYVLGALGKDRRPSTGSDEGYSSRVHDSLKRREEALITREKLLMKREKEFDLREKSIGLREKLAEDRMARAEKMLQDYAELRIKSVVSRPGRRSLEDSDMDQLSDDDTDQEDRPRGSCLLRTKTVDSPKKQVSFSLDKENDIYSMGLPDDDDDVTSKPRSGTEVVIKTREKRRPTSAGSRLQLEKGRLKDTEVNGDRYSPETRLGTGLHAYRNGVDLTKDIYRGHADPPKISPRDRLSTETRLQQEHARHMSDLRERLRRVEVRSSEMRYGEYGDYQSKYSSKYSHQALGIR